MFADHRFWLSSLFTPLAMGKISPVITLLTRRSPRHSAPTSHPDVLGGGLGGGDVVEHATREGKDG